MIFSVAEKSVFRRISAISFCAFASLPFRTLMKATR